MSGDITVVAVEHRVVVRDPVARVSVVRTPQRVAAITAASSVRTVRVPARVLVQGVGAQGPPGPPGPAETQRIEFDVTAGFDISAYHLVVPRIVEGTVRLADNSVMSHSGRPIWLALTSALTGEAFTVLAAGLVTNPAWAWAQAPIFLGENGELTQTPPAAPDASFSAQVGYAVGPASMFFERTAPILLI